MDKFNLGLPDPVVPVLPLYQRVRESTAPPNIPFYLLPVTDFLRNILGIGAKPNCGVAPYRSGVHPENMYWSVLCVCGFKLGVDKITATRTHTLHTFEFNLIAPHSLLAAAVFNSCFLSQCSYISGQMFIYIMTNSKPQQMEHLDNDV